MKTLKVCETFRVWIAGAIFCQKRDPVAAGLVPALGDHKGRRYDYRFRLSKFIRFVSLAGFLCSVSSGQTSLNGDIHHRGKYQHESYKRDVPNRRSAQSNQF